MPFVEGESLRGRLKREGQLPLADALRITSEIASALGYAHRHGVVHRDLKPDNVMFQDGQALLMDFGIALPNRDEESRARLTGSGMTFGHAALHEP
jgi:serine/threonine-protein kinase